MVYLSIFKEYVKEASGRTYVYDHDDVSTCTQNKKKISQVIFTT